MNYRPDSMLSEEFLQTTDSHDGSVAMVVCQWLLWQWHVAVLLPLLVADVVVDAAAALPW